MLTSRHRYLAAIAATLVLTALPHTADARGGGGGHGGGMGGHMGTMTSHILAPGAMTPGTSPMELGREQHALPGMIPGTTQAGPEARLQSGLVPANPMASPRVSPLATTPSSSTPQPPSTPAQTAAAAANAAISASATAGIATTTIPTTQLPPSAIGTPAAQQTAIAPLSPDPAQIIDSSGGIVTSSTTTSSAVASSATSGASPSESAPSAPGGGGDTLDACMGFWDSGTHMTKVQWRAACTRTLNRLDLRTPVP